MARNSSEYFRGRNHWSLRVQRHTTQLQCARVCVCWSTSSSIDQFARVWRIERPSLKEAFEGIVGLGTCSSRKEVEGADFLQFSIHTWEGNNRWMVQFWFAMNSALRNDPFLAPDLRHRWDWSTWSPFIPPYFLFYRNVFESHATPRYGKQTSDISSFSSSFNIRIFSKLWIVLINE